MLGLKLFMKFRLQLKPNKSQTKQKAATNNNKKSDEQKKIRTFTLKESEFYLLNFITYTCRCFACVNNQKCKTCPPQQQQE